MRVALIGDFDTFLCRGLERPRELLPYRLSPGLNLLRGFREIGLTDVHIIVITSEVRQPTVEEGPWGMLHRLPRQPLSGSTSFFLWRRHTILAELKKIQPDIVHGQGTENASAFTAVTSPYPNVITFHGIMHRVQKVVRPPLFSLSHVMRWTEKLVVKKATDVICLSGEVESFLRERRSPARCHRIPNAVAPCFFDVHPVRRSGGEHALLFVGTIYPLKGLLELVEAMAGLEGATRLRVVGNVGSAAYVARVQDRARELGVADRIERLGVLGERGVAAALVQSDVLVLPSFQETAPMAVAEAMAAGVPVVATRAGGTPELVEHEKTGLLVTPGNSEELADALGRLLADAGMRERLGAAARAKALAQYAPRVVAQKTLKVYESILKARP
jgi:glycosyltransferase involved in cell wall biosynthesis